MFKKNILLLSVTLMASQNVFHAMDNKKDTNKSETHMISVSQMLNRQLQRQQSLNQSQQFQTLAQAALEKKAKDLKAQDQNCDTQVLPLLTSFNFSALTKQDHKKTTEETSPKSYNILGKEFIQETYIKTEEKKTNE